MITPEDFFYSAKYNQHSSFINFNCIENGYIINENNDVIENDNLNVILGGIDHSILGISSRMFGSVSADNTVTLGGENMIYKSRNSYPL